MTRKLLLHVGCGPQSHEALPPLDWQTEWRQVRLDVDPDVDPDILGDITDLSMIEDDSIDFVFSKHNIEHLEQNAVPVALREFYRILKPTGFLAIRCPDLESVARRLLNGDPEEVCWISTLHDGRRVEITLLDVIYGARSEIARGNPYMAHRTGFTRASMKRHLEVAGFERISVNRTPKSLELLASGLKEAEGNEYYKVRAHLAAIAREHQSP